MLEMLYLVVEGGHHCLEGLLKYCNTIAHNLQAVRPKSARDCQHNAG